MNDQDLNDIVFDYTQEVKAANGNQALEMILMSTVQNKIKTLMLKTMREANYDPTKFGEMVEEL